jgi:hypothetical protein
MILKNFLFAPFSSKKKKQKRKKKKKKKKDHVSAIGICAMEERTPEIFEELQSPKIGEVGKGVFS